MESILVKFMCVIEGESFLWNNGTYLIGSRYNKKVIVCFIKSEEVIDCR